MISTLHELGIADDASHTATAEHVYNYMRRKCPTQFPCAWSHAPEPLRQAITLAVITGADHASARLAASLHGKLEQVGA